jgi:hypothetical protein
MIKKLPLLAIYLMSYSNAQNTSYSIIGWGRNPFGQLEVPSSIQGKITSISAGGNHVVSLLNDGSIRCWGAGKVKSSEYPNFGQSNPPQFSQKVLAIAAGLDHSLALLSDGTVAAWGAGSPQEPFGQSTVPDVLKNPSTARVKKIFAGGRTSFALRQDGTLVGWGDNTYGQATPPPELVGVSDLSITHYHAIALKNDGKIVCWGRNNSNQCVIPENLPPVTQVAAGNENTAVVLADGSLRWWGANYTLPNLPQTYGNISKVALGYEQLAILTNSGEVVIWGNDGGAGATIIPTEAKNASDIAMGLNHFMFSMKPQRTEISEYIETNPGGNITVDATPENTDSGPYAYRWYFDGVAVPISFGGTQPQITLTGIKEAEGSYSVEITGINGKLTKTFVFRIRIDSDGDGLSDGREQFIHKTDPLKSDSDGDGLNDFTEVQLGSNPLAIDSDDDGFSDDYEYRTGYSPIDPTQRPDLFMTIHPCIEIRFPSAIGKTYSIESSANLQEWDSVEIGIQGTGGIVSRYFNTDNSTGRFFRARESRN